MKTNSTKSLTICAPAMTKLRKTRHNYLAQCGTMLVVVWGPGHAWFMDTITCTHEIAC